MTAEVIPDFLAVLIDEIAVREGFTANAYSVTPTIGSKLGDGFQGVLMRISIEGERTVAGVSQTNSRLALICKLPPADQARREMFKSSEAFEREIYAYTTILPLMTEFQNSKGISPELGFYEFPKCYGTVADATAGNYALVLADMKAESYEMWNRFETLDFEHAKLAMTELGKFHALTFALRDQRPAIFETLKALRSDTLVKMAELEMTKPFWQLNYKMASETLNADETELREKMSIVCDSYLERMRVCMADGAAEPFGVLNHGDFWNNNMMYLYTENSKRAQGVCVIDWQIVQFCSPAIDISYFLFSSTEHELRTKHFWDLIQVYYDSLAGTLRALGSDPEQLFRFEDLRAQLKQFAQYGLVMAPMLVQVVTAIPDELPDLDEMARKIADNKMDKFEGFVGKDNQMYHKRMGDVVRDYFALGFDL